MQNKEAAAEQVGKNDSASTPRFLKRMHRHTHFGTVSIISITLREHPLCETAPVSHASYLDV